eukprot:TRINITY_DN1335_c0_g1_i5.p2 TRINITY_DN1335_c0_g1~~TRINITY_DN1335_c0_g1_i5.p2  ORF type:complete len:411 (+),score=95.67 TRINITY_DN1335_c0_g1_i5:81-1235(+)
MLVPTGTTTYHIVAAPQLQIVSPPAARPPQPYNFPAPPAARKGWPPHPRAAPKRPCQGESVMLTGGPPPQRCALRTGEVGVVLFDDHSLGMPFCVEGPRGDRDWYGESEIVRVADRLMNEEQHIAAEQLFRKVSETHPLEAARVVAVIIDTLSSSGIDDLLADTGELLRAQRDAALELIRDADEQQRKREQSAARPLPLELSAVCPVSPQSPQQQPPQPPQPPQSPPQVPVPPQPPQSPPQPPQSPPQPQQHAGESLATPSRPTQLRESSPGSEDTMPTVSAPTSSSGTSPTAGRVSRPASPVGRQQLGDTLYDRVAAIGPCSAAGKVTGMLMDALGDDDTLRGLLRPEGHQRLAQLVDEALAVLRDVGKLPGAVPGAGPPQSP